MVMAKEPMTVITAKIVDQANHRTYNKRLKVYLRFPLMDIHGNRVYVAKKFRENKQHFSLRTYALPPVVAGLVDDYSTKHYGMNDGLRDFTYYHKQLGNASLIDFKGHPFNNIELTCMIFGIDDRNQRKYIKQPALLVKDFGCYMISNEPDMKPEIVVPKSVIANRDFIYYKK